MIIIADYTIDRKNGFLFVVNTGTVPVCPYCGGTLIYRDRRRRICRNEGGDDDHFMIRRLRCKECGSLHNELPDCLVPHKHYGTEVISGVLDGTVTQDDLDSEDRPCHETMRRWIYWFRGNLMNIEGHLRRAGHVLLGLGEDILCAAGSLAGAIHSAYDDWLERILMVITNSGGKLG